MIRCMCKEDLDQVVEIVQCTGLSWSIEQLKSSLNHGHWCFVFQDKELINGFIIAMNSFDVCELLLIAVRPDQQGQGIGHQLIQEIYIKMGQFGLSRLLLEVKSSNQKAQDFYLKEGFAKIGVRKKYYVLAHGQYEDALIYAQIRDL